MSKSSRIVVCLAVTLALSVPAFAWAQAVPRGGGGSSSSGSSGGGSNSGSSGGSSNGGSDYSPPPPPPPPPAVRTAPPESSRSRNPNSSNSSTSGGQRSGAPGDPSGGADPRFRNRAGRPMTGMAVARERERSGAGISALGSWGLYYPWYGSGLNWNFGYAAYNPFLSGYSRWTWGRYGMWADPYDPFGYNYGYGPGLGYGYGYGPGLGYGYGDPFDADLYAAAYGYGGGSSGGGYSSSRGSEAPEPTGSVRLRVKPADGKVYLDGTMIGVVDDFDGLSSHLAAPAGRHEIEVRAEGYQPLKIIVDIERDKTVTARGTLKKK